MEEVAGSGEATSRGAMAASLHVREWDPNVVGVGETGRLNEVVAWFSCDGGGSNWCVEVGGFFMMDFWREFLESF